MVRQDADQMSQDLLRGLIAPMPIFHAWIDLGGEG